MLFAVQCIALLHSSVFLNIPGAQFCFFSLMLVTINTCLVMLVLCCKFGLLLFDFFKLFYYELCILKLHPTLGLVLMKYGL